MSETKMTARDGKPGCPVTVWDGPYSTRCGAGASTGRCAHHGPFATAVPEADDYEPVELTKAERAALMHHIGGWKFERQGLAAAEDAFMAEVARIKAAARREALLEAADRAEGAIRVSDPLFFKAGVEAVVEALRKSVALAEPERDEVEPAVTVWDEITEGVTLHDVRKPERDEEGGR